MDFAASVLQSISGLTFSTFTLMHLGGHFLSPLSFKWADTAMFASRELYQSHAVELWMIGGALLVHVLSSATRYLLRKNKTSPIGVIHWHRYAGYATTMFLIPHVIGSRLSPLLCNT